MTDQIEHEIEQLKKQQAELQRRLEEIEAFVSRFQEWAVQADKALQKADTEEDPASHLELGEIMEVAQKLGISEAAKKLGISPRILRYKLLQARSISIQLKGE